MKRLILTLLLITLLTTTTHATSTLISNDIKHTYTAGQPLQGTITLTLENEPANAEFTSNFNGNTTLQHLLNLNNYQEGIGYTCTTPNCNTDYAPAQPITETHITNNNPTTIGHSITGQSIHITHAQLQIQTTTSASCTNQIEIDILNNEQNTITNTQHTTDLCPTTYTGCYDPSQTTQATIVKDKKYCEQVTLPAAPAYTLGATTTQGSGSTTLTMSLHDAQTTNELGNCQLPGHNVQTETLSCMIEYPTLEQNTYFICLESSDSAQYTIRWETQPPTCGTAEGFSQLNSDFDLFAQTHKYAATPTITLNDNTLQNLTGQSYTDTLNTYLQNQYGNNCQQRPCIIPITLKGQDQTISLTPTLTYETVGVPTTTTDINNLTEETSLINAHNITLNLEKINFTLPIGSQTTTFELKLGNHILLEHPITPQTTFNFEVGPTFAPFGTETTYTIITSETIKQATWTFGDNTPPKTTTTSKTTHTYTDQNTTTYTLTVNATNTANVTSTKTFTIVIGNPKDVANNTIQHYYAHIANISDQINTYENWIATKLQDLINIPSINTTIKTAETNYNNAINENDYQNVMLELIRTTIPTRITSTQQTDIPLSTTYNSINPTYIETISNRESTNTQELIDRITQWADANFNARADHTLIQLTTQDGTTEDLLTTYTLHTNPKQTLPLTTYLILGQPINTAGAYKETTNYQTIPGSGTNYLEIDTGKNEHYTFYLQGNIPPQTLGAYLSPSIDNLPITTRQFGTCNLNNICDNDETSNSCPEDCNTQQQTITLTAWIIIAILTLTTYIILGVVKG